MFSKKVNTSIEKKNAKCTRRCQDVWSNLHHYVKLKRKVFLSTNSSPVSM